jgi:hypothetical protein
MKLILTIFLTLPLTVLAQGDLFPSKIKGTWSRDNFSNTAEVDLIQMQGSDKAQIKYVFWDGCSHRGQTTAELKEGAWEFKTEGGFNSRGSCMGPIVIKMKKDPATNRYEGTFTTIKNNVGKVSFTPQ